jgi:hypothetical protein
MMVLSKMFIRVILQPLQCNYLIQCNFVSGLVKRPRRVSITTRLALDHSWKCFSKKLSASDKYLSEAIQLFRTFISVH